MGTFLIIISKFRTQKSNDNQVSSSGIQLFSLLICFSIVNNIYSQETINAYELRIPVIIDGVVDNEWRNADIGSDFTQLQPAVGENASRKTKTRVALYGNNLYLLFECFVNSSNEIVSRIQRRDQLSESDDLISIVLDTYNDKRTSYLFMVNAMGTQTDAKISDDGKKLDQLWDTEWNTKTSINDSSWIVEVEIPLKSIQYKPGADSWGLNLGRVIRENNEISWWSPVTEMYRVSQNGKLTGVQPELALTHRLRLFPYATGRVENSSITNKQNEVLGDAGLDLEYQYKSNLITNITINPDFATVEGDREKINLTPWEIRFPDKRLFFQNGNEMFGTRIQTFYSRRIGDMKYGGKVIGKSGRFQYNALTAATEKNEISDEPEAFFNAFRLKTDVLKSSTIGLTYTDKITDTAYVRSYSADYVLNLGKTWKLTGQYVGSAPGDWASHSAWYLRFARENNIYHYHVRFTSIGNKFKETVDQTGYVNDDDRREIDSDVAYRFWINKSISYIYLLGKNNIYWSQHDYLRSWDLNYSGRIYASNKFSLDFKYNNEFKDKYRSIVKDYYNYYYNGVLGYNTDEASYASIGYRQGRNFDRNFNWTEFKTKFQLWNKLTLNYEFNYIYYTPDVNRETRYVNITGLDYFFTNNLWVRLFAQSRSDENRFYFYGLIGWRFKPPFGAAYLIVNSDSYQNYKPNSDAFEDKYHEVVYFKLTYPLTVINR